MAGSTRVSRRLTSALRIFFVAAAASAAVGASAQTYPTKPIHIVVPSAAGGAADALARQVGGRLAARFGQQVVVENKPGANTQIAAEYVAKAAPDGHTLLLGPDVTFVVNPSLYSKLPYDPVKDFEPVTGLAVLYQALVANPSVPANSVGELIALAKAKPGAINYGTFGIGSAGHLNMEAFESLAGVRLTPVHYRGAAPAFTDVIAGHIQVMFVSFGSAVEAWKAGKVKILAVGRPSRMADYPDLPTVAEAGVPGFEAKSWFGLFATGGTSRAIVDQLNTEVGAIFGEHDFQDVFLKQQMMEPIVSSPDDYAKLIHSDSRKWDSVIKGAHLKID